MEYLLAGITLASALFAVFGERIKQAGAHGSPIVKWVTIVLAVCAFAGSCALVYRGNSNKDFARSLIRQGESRAVSSLLEPVSLFYGDYLGGMYIEKLDMSKVRAPEVMAAMQEICFSESPKNVISVPAQTWGDKFGGSIRGGIGELKETLSLYQSYMTPSELQVLQNLERDGLVREALARRDYSHETDGPLTSKRACGGIRPIGLFKNYLQHVSDLQTAIDRDGQ
jgi:hypothetical protein